jgi:hypothetical protein
VDIAPDDTLAVGTRRRDGAVLLILAVQSRTHDDEDSTTAG